MGYVNILTTSGYGKTGSSQSNIAALTGWAVKVRFDGALVTGLGDYEMGGLVEIWNNSDAFKVRLCIERQLTNVHGYMSADYGTIVGGTYIPISNFSGGNDYVLYAHFFNYAPPSGDWFGFHWFEADGTEIDNDMFDYDPSKSDLTTGYGHVRIGGGYSGGTTVPEGKIDGVAIYSYELTGDNKWNEPQNTDSNILWYVPFDETSGNTAANDVSGATSLTMQGSEDTDFSWVAGGGWDATEAAPDEFVTVYFKAAP